MPLPPGPKGAWLFGTANAFARDPLAYCRKHCPNYPGILTIMRRPRKLVMVWDPTAIKQVLQDNPRNYVKGYGYRFMRPLLGNGLLLSEGNFWMKQRRLMQPAFHKKAVAGFARIMDGAANRCLERLDEAAAAGRPVDLSAEMGRVTMEIVSQSLLGSDVEGDLYALSADLEQANRDASDRIDHPFRPPLWMPTPGNRRVRRGLARLRGTIDGFIERRRRAGEAGEDLLGMLLAARDEETGRGMDDAQLRDEIATIFVAGHETTANAMTWTLYALDRHPGALDRLRREITPLGGRAPTLEESRGLTYVSWTVAESLRLFPPAWIVARGAVAEDELAGARIPAGTNVLILPLWQHRRPDYWGDPEVFRPERHGEERTMTLPRYAYFPFGGGPRLCIGVNFARMEMQLLLPALLGRFRFRAAEPGPAELDPLITLHPRGGMRMRVERVGAERAVGA